MLKSLQFLAAQCARWALHTDALQPQLASATRLSDGCDTPSAAVSSASLSPVLISQNNSRCTSDITARTACC